MALTATRPDIVWLGKYSVLRHEADREGATTFEIILVPTEVLALLDNKRLEPVSKVVPLWVNKALHVAQTNQ